MVSRSFRKWAPLAVLVIFALPVIFLMGPMVILISIFALPVVFLVWLAVEFFTKDRRGVAPALLFFALALVAGFWGITQSHSSTAGIGVFFLPDFGMVAGLFGLAYGRLRHSAKTGYRAFAYVALALAIATIALLGHEVLNNWPLRFNNGVR